MMNQDQYHASLLNKGKVGLGWDGVTKASQTKPLPYEPPNPTDPEQVITKITDDDSKTIEVCLNNIKLSDNQLTRYSLPMFHLFKRFVRLFKAAFKNHENKTRSVSHSY